MPPKPEFNSEAPTSSEEDEYGLLVMSAENQKIYNLGKYYHMQANMAAEGLTVINNELIYCLNTGD